MRLKKSAAVLVSFVVLLLLSILDWHASAGTVPPGAPPAVSEAGIADKTHVVEAVPRVRRIGAAPGEAFQVVLDVSPEAISRAFLVYELAGVPHWSAAVRSINGLPVEGGFGAVASSGTNLQREEINPRWLRSGVNQIVFSPAPAGERQPAGLASLREQDALAPEGLLPYTVRNLRIVYVQGEGRPAARLRISHPLHGE